MEALRPFDQAAADNNVLVLKQLISTTPVLTSESVGEALCVAAEHGSAQAFRYLITCVPFYDESINWCEVTAAAVNASQQSILDCLVVFNLLQLEDGPYYKMGFFTTSLSVLKWCHQRGLHFYQDDYMWQEHCDALARTPNSQTDQSTIAQLEIVEWLVDINCCTNAYLPMYKAAEFGNEAVFHLLQSKSRTRYPVNTTTYSIAKQHGHCNIANHIQRLFTTKAAARMPVQPVFR